MVRVRWAAVLAVAVEVVAIGGLVTAHPAIAVGAAEVPVTRPPQPAGTVPPGTGPPAPAGPFEIALRPDGPVRDGTSAHILVDGADTAARTLPVALCGGAGDGRRCSTLGDVTIGPDGHGERDVYLESPAVLGADPAIDCRVDDCAIEVVRGRDRATRPVTFDGARGDRYTDRVFPDIDVTRGLVYGRATGIVALTPAGGAYGDGPPEDLRLDLYEPRGDSAAARPVIVYVHGGYYSPDLGYDRSTRDEAVRFANDWTRRGYVVAAVDYRLISGPLTDPARLARAVPAAQHDAQAAVRWLRTNAERYRLSRSAIGVAGYSAGATTALTLGFFAHDPGDSGNPGESSAVAAVLSMSGSLPVPEVVGTDNYPPYAEPLRPGAPPVLMMNATGDTIVPYAWATGTRSAITASGNTCELVTYPGLDHIFIPEMDHDLMPRAARFFASTLAPLLGRPAVATAASPVAVRITPRFTG